ncbi:repressor [Rhizobium sp. Leaf384]|nr:repressor [Rhizobium sp. Leaf384]
MISMAKGEHATKIGIAIRTARKRRGLVQRNIAQQLGIDVAAVGMWETGRNLPSPENLLRTAEFLRVDPSALMRGDLVYQDDEALADAEVVSDGFVPNLGPMDIEMLGVIYGGDDGDFTFNGTVAGYVRRPQGIANLKNVWATHVLGDSMVPKFDPGDVIYCGGREPVPGDCIVIELYPDNEGESTKAYVKLLKRRTAKEIITEQYNPKKEVIYDRYRVKNLWRVIPWKELLGF